MTDEAHERAQTGDDRPAPARPVLSPDLISPLATYAGAKPPAPQWFREAIAHAPERGFVESRGTRLEVLTWGEVGRPGLLFIHGNSAHADWWSFIAPFFAADYRVAAVSTAGMGGSDWRETYAMADFPGDAEAVARAAGLHASGAPPVYVGHSFGGAQTLYAAIRTPGQMRGAIIIDSGFRPRVARSEEEPVRSIPTADRAFRVYPDQAAALARFRLMPPQPVANAFIADFIARRSLKRAPAPDGRGEGWTWRFDPLMWSKLERAGWRPEPGMQAGATMPMVHIYGALSQLMVHREEGAPAIFPPHCQQIEIPEAHHHVMIDQPLALVSAIRAVLAGWPPAAHAPT